MFVESPDGDPCAHEQILSHCPSPSLLHLFSPDSGVSHQRSINTTISHQWPLSSTAWHGEASRRPSCGVFWKVEGDWKRLFSFMLHVATFSKAVLIIVQCFSVLGRLLFYFHSNSRALLLLPLQQWGWKRKPVPDTQEDPETALSSHEQVFLSWTHHAWLSLLLGHVSHVCSPQFLSHARIPTEAQAGPVL